MSLSKGTIKVVLIQVRDQRHIAEHERDCFAERLGRDRVELHTLNVTENPNISISDVDPYAAVILGGAGAHTVTEDYDFTAPMTDLVLKLVDADRPIFGSCWGHQFIAKVLGGSVITESVFAMNGLGRFALQSIVGGDIPTVQMLIFVFAIVFVAMNLLADILNAALDPRIRIG